MNDTTPRPSASASTSKIRIAARRSGRSDTVAGAESSQGAMESGSLVSRAPNPTPEVMDAKRAALLEEKQVKLEQVVDKHDDLVRELFHMQQFTMMILYDPVEAKRDNSEVFQEFKAGFDLFANAVPTSQSSRQTRRKLNERRQILQSPSAVSRSSIFPPKKKRKTNSEELWNVIASSKNLRKPGKAKEEFGLKNEQNTVGRNGAFVASAESLSSPTAEESVFVRRKSRVTAPLVPPLSPSVSGEVVVVPATKKRRLDDSPLPATIRLSPEKIHDETVIIHPNGVKENTYPPSLHGESISTGIGRQAVKFRDVTLHKKLPEGPKFKPRFIPPRADTPPTPKNLPESPSKSNIKRIKLIVRRPPPQLSNPKQKPPLPKFNSSLNEFLSSYISVDEGRQNVVPSSLEKKAVKEAHLRAKVSKLRRDGRFIPRQEVKDDESDIDDANYVSPERTSKDHWDALVEDVIVQYQGRPKRSIAIQVTASIASKMQAYFDSLEMKRQKAKEAEEKKLKNLAKSTMRIVIAEWKKAVFHIREKQRLAEEEEERRLGHAHLDAILSQSGQILETQQEDLSRGDVYRSRSQSGSVAELDVDSDTDLEAGMDNEPGEEVVEEEAGAGEKAEEGPEEFGSLMLVDDTVIEPSTRSGTPSTNVSEASDVEDDAEDGLTAQLLGGYPTVGQGDDADVDSSSEADLDDLRHPNPESPVAHFRHNKISKPGGSGNVGSDDRDSAYRELPVRELDTIASPLPDAPGDPIFCQRAFSPTLQVAEHLEQQTSAEVRNDDGLFEAPEVASSVQDSEVEENSGATKEGDHSSEKGSQQQEEHDADVGQGEDEDIQIPEHLKPYAVAPVKWDSNRKVTPPLLLRGVLRPYQQSGLEWLASLHTNKLNGILADEMGLGKTIQTIALLAHLACDLGIWGPHLIIVPTSVLLNWEMELKKFLPGFRSLSYHGSTKRRKELRQGWNDKHHFNVCITSYALASRDAHIFRRKAWYYMILDEAHMIKNFKSQRWNILLMFRSYRRLLLTGTPLQNNLTELWALLQFLMSGANFANLKEFGEWFSNPLEKAIEMGNILDDETLQRVSKLHTVLRPYLLRRLKRDVEKELPSKFDHLTLCPLSKRQRFLYDEFMSRAQTKDALQSGVYQKIANILMQLRKVCNHPDLFEVRPVVTSFALTRSAIADYEIKEFLVRRQLFNDDEHTLNLDALNLRFIDRQNVSLLQALETRRLDASTDFPFFGEDPPELPFRDTRTIEGFRKSSASLKRAEGIARWTHIGYLNRLRCSRMPIYGEECISMVKRMTTQLIPFSHLDLRFNYTDNVDRVNLAVTSYSSRAQAMAETINIFAFVTPPVVALDLTHFALVGYTEAIRQQPLDFDDPLHAVAVKLQIAFPEPALLQYDCGKLQQLAILLREKKTGGHRVLIFTQMTRILDILEVFLNFHGYLYLRLDGATKIEDRQYITERFNADPRVFCFISSSRSGGVGINLTGADTVIFYDSDFNPQMDKQCEDRAHRIGQIRDVHIYRFVSQYTVEEAMLRKANQKRSLDDLVIQRGEFDWRTLFSDESTSALTKALDEYEDAEDRLAAIAAAREETSLVGADEDDFDEGDGGGAAGSAMPEAHDDSNEIEEEQGGAVVDYMISYVEHDWDHFSEWRV